MLLSVQWRFQWFSKDHSRWAGETSLTISPKKSGKNEKPCLTFVSVCIIHKRTSLDREISPLAALRRRQDHVTPLIWLSPAVVLDVGGSKLLRNYSAMKGRNMVVFKTSALSKHKYVQGAKSIRKRCYRPTLEALEQRCLLSVDMVVRWNEIANQAAANDYSLAPGYQIGPTRLGRAMAIVQAAVYDAANSIDPQFRKYLVQVAAPPDASMDAAVAKAAHDTLVAMFPNQQAFFDNELASSLAGIPMMPPRIVEGVAVGSAVASYCLAVRATDGSQIDAAGQPVNYTYGQLPGQWRADPLHPNATPLTPDWGSVKPFGVPNATRFLPPPPPTLDSLAYATAYEEVKTLGALNSTVRTPEQTQIAFFWGYDAQPGLCAPIRLYNQIAEVIAQQEGNNEVDNARFFALVNIAMADAGIVCWDAKYLDNFWRPITAIRENDPGTGPSGLGSGNPFLVGQGDPSWQPLGAPAHNGAGNFTPPFPSYTSGHATIGAALFKMMENYYGTDNVHFTITTDEFNTITGAALPPRSFDSFSQAAGENAYSRIYLGIHFHFDATNGIHCGDQIADYVFQHNLLPLHGRPPRALPSMDAEAQIQLAINYQSDQGANYQVGKALELIAAATAQFDGHPHSAPGGLGGISIGSAVTFSSSPTVTFDVGSANARHGDGFTFSGHLDLGAGLKKNSATGETESISRPAILTPSFWDEFSFRW